MTTTVKPSNNVDIGSASVKTPALEKTSEAKKGNSIKDLVYDILHKITGNVKTGNSFVVHKELDGTFRWFGIVTNKWKDREGETLTDMAHVEFKNFLDQHPEYAPELWTWHTPGSARKHKADWWEYTSGFFLYSGVLTEAEAKVYEKNIGEPIGMSHGFYVLEKVGPYILKYRTFEVSELPLANAANGFTSFSRIKEEGHMFSQRKRSYLVKRLGEEVVAELEQDVDTFAKTLKKLNVNWEEINKEYETRIETALAEKVAKASEQTVERVVSEVVDALNVKGLKEILAKLNADVVTVKEGYETRIGQLEANVTMLKETEDARIAKALTPAEPLDWNFAASASDKNIVGEDEVEKEIQADLPNGGEFEWLREGFGPDAGGNV